MVSESELLASVPTQLWIGGPVDATGGATFPVENPATGETLIEVADAGPEDAVRALDAAAAVQEQWAATPARERGEILRAVYERIIARTEEFALLMTLEMGKALPESRNEVRYGAEFFRWFSEEAVRVHGRYQTAPTGTGRIVVHKQPVGPCLAITPWNFPLAMGTRKIGPALAAGCTMIVKPASATPLTMLLLAKLCSEAGLPDGVLSVITSSRSSAVTEPLLNDSRLRKLTFTGSTAVGKKLVEKSANKLLRTSMELGGNAPFVVFADADIDEAVKGAMLAKLRNGGEACTAANRFHVHNSVREEFTEKFAAAMREVELGAGADPKTTLGPLINEEQLTTVSELVEDAVAKGAQVRLGGKAPGGPGYYYPATILADVPAEARILSEEVFGPVAPIVGFDTEEEGLAAANDTEFGLVAYIYTRDLDRALRIAEGLESGMVGVNRGVISDPAAPFGGVKESGFGREGGFEGIEEYLSTKYIALQ
ncbi:NAD-dependent succinate-semialdehyde dehydrogenase [Nocardia sp. CDC159]|uniref:NAD-dependent succinate-semialdehyde dehydrogenase n=1 Tax=Nocardia pulmonis TaxID=2951408 RepID=A0A9X2EB62_9NOCA|nr:MULTISPECIES: NAD-dependent succinate-semialdehyde dehydrogenase [Nocardia]MCM6775141.1 NAD-dependent succinate-semialdehyde dehydrogenase [Nocardia pulmonis]MCM6789611.1 NAD-dependent succinate-semialdehyde dehydrogenase [Nocardia sp. CDC159]